MLNQPRASGKKRFPLSALACAIALISPAAISATPDAGLLNNQLQQQPAREMPALLDPGLTLPATRPDDPRPSEAGDSDKVIIQTVLIQGLEDSSISDDLAQQQIASFLNKPLTFSQLQQMANRITALCRSQDMPLAQAILPPQTIRDQRLRIQVITGHYDNSRISNQSLLSDRLAGQILSSRIQPGKPVRRSDLEHVALLLSDLPGVHTQLVLQPGRLSGSSSVQAQISPGSRYSGYLAADNLGDPATGRSRIMAGGYLNQLLGSGDQLHISLLSGWEKNGMFSGLLDYSTLINGSATRAGLNYSYFHYRYQLSGLSFNGYSHNWNLYLSQPWLRRSGARLDAGFEAGQQFVRDFYPEGLSPNKRYKVSAAALTLQGVVASTAGGLSRFSLRGTTGRADGGGLAFSHPGNLHFSRLNYHFSHLQAVRPPLSLLLSVKGQIPNQNLPASQKFLLGGYGAVRAYDTGNGVADSGILFSAELRSRWDLPFSLAGSQPALGLTVFYDQGWGQQYKTNANRRTGKPFLLQDNRINLAGAGISLSLISAQRYSLTLSWAHRTGRPDPVSGYRGRDRLWLSAMSQF